MSRQIYDRVFVETFDINEDDLNESLEYQSIPAWDSVGHMSLIAALEDEFEISFEMDDVIEFGTYQSGIDTLRKYGVQI